MAKRLLVVDDEPHLLRALEACLRAKGYEVTTSRSGADALVKLSQTAFDLVVSDIRMPGMDGYELARRVRAAPRTELIPIVFLTARDQTADRIAGFRTGVDAYLTKPFETEELIAIIESILIRVERTHAAIAELVSPPVTGNDQELGDEGLTDAEKRVAVAVARGLMNKEIAAELDISTRTVENHISHILAKKGFGNRVELARYVLERQSSI